MNYLLVFLGSGLGGTLRHTLNQLITSHLGSKLPYGIFVINVTGSFALGLLTGYFALRGGAPQQVRLFLTTGIIAGYTTFSTFSLDTVVLWERGEFLASILYVLLSVSVSVAAMIAGMWVMRATL